MAIDSRKQFQAEVPQQGKAAGWIVWVLLSIPAFFLPAQQAFATIPVPSQTTFGAVGVGQTSALATITLTAQATGTSAAPTVLTEGTASAGVAEFVLGSAGTCGSSPSLSPGQSCTVSVSFSPRFPGFRHGAVVLQTSGGQLLASKLISGVGQGGLPVLIPGQIGTVAGDGQWFYQGDNVPATQAPIYLPSGLAVDGAGNLFLSDTINNRVRRVDAVTLTITTVAGNGTPGSNGDGGAATAAELSNPSGLALDGAGNLYIADTGNNAIRSLNAADGTIATVAGMLGAAGYSGDGHSATAAALNAPQGIALTPSGDLLIADTGNDAIRLVTASDGEITTIAGTGTPGYNGDNVPAISAELNEPAGVAIGPDGSIAIADLTNNRVRLFTVGGTITTLAGVGSGGYTGDGGNAQMAELQGPAAVAFDPAGDLLIADSVNNCIRLVYGPENTITTLAGTPTDDRFAGDGGPDNAARLHGPDAIVFDAAGNLWIADRFNNRIREVNGSLLTIGPYPTMKVGKTSSPVAEQMFNAGNQPLSLSSPTVQQAALDSTSTTCAQAGLSAAQFCQMGVEFAPQNVGSSIDGTITWTSDAPNVTPLDQLYGKVLEVEPTTVVITASANPGYTGQPLTLTATVTSADLGRTGTVDFLEGSVLWCSAVPLAGDGTASCSISSLSLGAHNFIANYSGDSNNAASQSPVFTETIKQQTPTATALSSASSNTLAGESVSFSVSVSGAGGTPTGTITFKDGGTVLGTSGLDPNGSASFSTPGLSTGNHIITASYSGDANFLASTSASLQQTVTLAQPRVLLSGPAGAVQAGTAVPFQIALFSPGATPTGSITLLDGAAVVATQSISSPNGITLTVANLALGTHAFTASYSGDVNNSPAVSAAVQVIIVRRITALTLTSDANPARTLTPVGLVATVTASGAIPATGLVTFFDGATALGSSQLGATGQASLTVPQLAAGTHALTASYAGDVADFPSTSPAYQQVVQLQPSTTTLTSTASDTSNPQQLTLIAVIKGSGSTPPTGTVNFTAGNITLGAAPVDPTGVASITVIFNTLTQEVVASYGGDISYSASQSAATPVTAGQPAQFTVTVSAPTVTLVSHQHTSITVTVASVKGFTDNIALGCLGLPYAATCTFDKSQVKLAADGSVTATLTLDTGDPLGAGSSTSASLGSKRTIFACILPATLFLTGLSRKNRRRTAMLLLASLLGIAFATGMSGCGGLQMSGTPPGNYSIRIIGTGQGSNTTQAQTINLVVTQ